MFCAAAARKTAREQTSISAVENVAVHVSMKSYVVGVMAAKRIWILNADHRVVIVSHEYNISTWRYTLLHSRWLWVALAGSHLEQLTYP
jgi:hypothetical protein